MHNIPTAGKALIQGVPSPYFWVGWVLAIAFRTAVVVAHPGKEDKLKALLLEIVEATRKEPGCITYELLQSPAIPTEFALVAEWESEQAWRVHLDSAHIQQAFLEGEELFASPPDIRHYVLLA